MKHFNLIGKVMSGIAIIFLVWTISHMNFSFWSSLPKDKVALVFIISTILYAFFFSFLAIGWSDLTPKKRTQNLTC